MKRKTIRKVFIAVLVYLPLQYAALGIIGYFYSEPWPAFVFPGFKNVYVYEQGFEINRTTFEIHPAAGVIDPVKVTPAQLFPEIPNSQVAGFIRKDFGNDEKSKKLSSEGKHWLGKQARRAAGFEVEFLIVTKSREYWQNRAGGMQLDSVVVLSENKIFVPGDTDE